jgi:NAD(P)-dependent dehydrogenase (short-subunit alcohol dehydrogenase family)
VSAVTSMQLDGKVAVVTGGGRGIGRAIALDFAAAGADVALAARSADQIEEVAGLIEAQGRRALPVVTDLRRPEQVTRLAETVASELGDVDVLVNNSGIAGPMGVLWELDPEAWNETVDVNLTGVFLCCRAFLPGMIERRSGNVIVIGSVTGKRPLHGRTPYAATKLALVGLVRTLAWEVGEYGIRVNLISPGAVAGERIERVIEGQAATKGITAEEARAELAGGSPLKRFVDPEHVAAAAVFLASDAGESVTGEDLNVAGGLAMF